MLILSRLDAIAEYVVETLHPPQSIIHGEVALMRGSVEALTSLHERQRVARGALNTWSTARYFNSFENSFHVFYFLGR